MTKLVRVISDHVQMGILIMSYHSTKVRIAISTGGAGFNVGS